VALGIRGGRRHPAHDAPDRIERRVYIAASPAAVWAALHDPAAARAIHPELRLGPPTLAWPAAGEIRSARVRIGLFRAAGSVESLEARPGRSFRYRLVAGPLGSEWTWRLEPTAGGTRAVHTVEGRVADRWSGWLAGVGGDPLSSAVEAHLRGLRAVSEGGSPAPHA
jgi:uncharacterized protein YndB with AHSA1/START domain